jgi:hypothetical protein
MDRYNLRTTSLNNTQLTTELTKRNAQTFGTVQRKQQRLQRFIDAETLHTERQAKIQRFLDKEDARAQMRDAIVLKNGLRRSGRVTRLLGEYLGY